MISLLKCEFKKFRRTYINSLSFLGMLTPVLLILLMFIFKKDYFIEHGSYTWENFNDQLQIFFVFLVGPIITSFIAVFSVYYEYQEKTMKNILTSPHGRISIILTKILYVSVYVVLQYITVAVIDVLCALLLGFDFTLNNVGYYSLHLALAGLSTVMLVPLMVFITLLFKSFIPPLVITVAGTISNVIFLNWEHSYISPWTLSADIMLILEGKLKMEMVYPVVSLVAYFFIFMTFALVYFNRADQSV